jgi:3-oxoacyl-[acyl-carrier-protein] synthase III
MLMHRAYSARKLEFRQILVISPEELGPVSHFDFTKEFTYADGMAVFVVESSPRRPLVFITIPVTTKRGEALTHFQAIFGSFSHPRFIDEDNDLIEIDGDDAWEYCVQSAAELALASRYTKLVLDVPAAQ